MATPIRLRITETAKEEIRRFLAKSNTPNALPGLLLTAGTKEQPATWCIGLYTEDQARDIEKMYAQNGFAEPVVLYEADGMNLCIPQTQLLSKLDGKTLDYRKRRYVVT